MAKRKGKYAGVIDKLPKFPMVEPDRRDLVDVVKQDILAPPQAGDPVGDPNQILDRMNGLMKMLLSIQKRATAGRPWAAEFARVYAELRKAKDHVEEWEKSLNLLLETYTALMVDQFEVEGISSVRLANGQPITTFPEPYAQVVDQDAYRRWCLEQGFIDKMQLPWQTTNSMTKEMLLKGEEQPPGVTVYAKTKIRLGAE